MTNACLLRQGGWGWGRRLVVSPGGAAAWKEFVSAAYQSAGEGRKMTWPYDPPRVEKPVDLIMSSYDMKTFIVDPTGSTLAEATPERPIAVAELHLDRKIVQPWLGDMRTRTWKERRPDIPVR